MRKDQKSLNGKWKGVQLEDIKVLSRVVGGGLTSTAGGTGTIDSSGHFDTDTGQEEKKHEDIPQQ